MRDFIKVKFKYYTTLYTIQKVLDKLEDRTIMSLDFETQSMYTVEERKEAKDLVKKHQDDLSSVDLRLSKVVANCSGLSHPSIVKITHIIFGISEDESIVLVINDRRTEQYVMNWIVSIKTKLIIHNSLFDLKLVYHRTSKLPYDYEDTQLFARTLVNHTRDWECRTGLKVLMGEYYDPSWTLIESYDIVDLKNKEFLRYCAIDGASAMKLWYMLQEMKDDT